jgi:CBS domain-containing protein
MDHLERLGEFSELGRGFPLSASRSAGALPTSPIVRQAYAPTPRARLGWGQGVISVSDVPLAPPLAVTPHDELSKVAERMRADDSDFVPVVEHDRFVGVVYIDALLRCVAGNQAPPDVKRMLSRQIPTCTPGSALVDAVRQMVSCYLRRIPVVGDDGELVGMLSLATAARAAERDPAVRDVLETAAQSPALFARRWR